MNETASKKLLYGTEIVSLVELLRDRLLFVSYDSVPSLELMLDSDPASYRYTKSFDEARDDPIAVLHSSGSTGTFPQR